MFIAGCGSYKDDIEPKVALDLIEFYLRENGLVRNPKRIITPPVKTLGRKAPEVPHIGSGDMYEPVQELPHPAASQSDPGANGLAGAHLEIRYALAGKDYAWLLTRDAGNFLDHILGCSLPLGLGRANVACHHDLLQLGDLVDVFQAEFFLERWDSLLLVVCQ